MIVTMMNQYMLPRVTATYGQMCGTAGEGGTINLTMPAGAVIHSINFLSYGTPNGTCGNYSTSSCHATKDYSSSIGQNSISVFAGIANFGVDPCPGTVKRAYLELTHIKVDPLPWE